ncbi:MAG TPA: mechanosensitive ion channel family protein [Candidatus Saccharimonadales bacterium]|nr:mechanosensitive ion channel family protein [Candidatus Saccharimonadales bacterium]
MWKDIEAWLTNNSWASILLIIGAAYLAKRFGAMFLEKVIRRTVRYHAHGDQSEEDTKKRQDTLISLFSTALTVLIWLVVGFTILGHYFQIELAPLIAASGVVGVALGFGAQSLIKDFISGLFIILENQYRVGDVVELDKAVGRVEQITIRSTVVRDNDGSVHYIPNGVIQHTINKTMGFARINLLITVQPNTDVDQLVDLVNGIGEKMASEEKWRTKIIDPPHFGGINNFTPSSLEIKISGKTQPTAQWNITNELRRRLLTGLNKAGMGAEQKPAPAKEEKPAVKEQLKQK